VDLIQVKSPETYYASRQLDPAVAQTKVAFLANRRIFRQG
jgi:hypothetical protein